VMGQKRIKIVMKTDSKDFFWQKSITGMSDVS
jgi:hypothetical protein